MAVLRVRWISYWSLLFWSNENEFQQSWFEIGRDCL